MSYRTEKLMLIWRTLLFGLLLAVQVQALAHELRHLPADGGGLCDMCSAGNGLNSATLDSTHPVQERQPLARPGCEPASLAPRPRTTPAAIRGPPSDF